MIQDVVVLAIPDGVNDAALLQVIPGVQGEYRWSEYRELLPPTGDKKGIQQFCGAALLGPEPDTERQQSLEQICLYECCACGLHPFEKAGAG